MASVSTPKSFATLADARHAVRSPLDRLRGYIRTYVSLEGAAVVAMYLALWFWIGLALDYGFFKAFTIDWVQELPWAVRAVLLAVLSAGLLAAVALTVLTRLFREFRDAALALVLERRFPRVLGDRLITAVELSDPEQAARHGYSPAMVRETIHEAARRVETLPVQEVFDWRRLRTRGALIAVLALGGYLLVGAAFTAAASARQGSFTLRGFRDFHDVALLWLERNILLQDTIWPRRAHLELVGFPASDEVRMGRGSTPPTLRVRALKYVIAGPPGREAVAGYRAWLSGQGVTGEAQDELVKQFSRRPAEGWRALSWFDLPALLRPYGSADSAQASLAALLASPQALPESWTPRDLQAGLTVDEIELQLDKPETHQTLAAGTHEGLRAMLADVGSLAGTPSMSRTLRVLQVPDRVLLISRGRTTGNVSINTLQKVADNEYTGSFGDLTESVTFTVQGEDYSTARRRVTLVEPPILETLTRAEERPAYLYYRPAKPGEVRGARQLFEESSVSLQGGEVSRIDLPAGSNVTLKAVASKDLQSVRLTLRAPTIGPALAEAARTVGDLAPQGLATLAGLGPLALVPLPEVLDARTFRVRLDNVRHEQAFTFEFLDTDGVAGQRQVTLVPAEDAPPKVRELAPDDIVRKVKEGYMVAVGARIPFKGKVSDDYGLSAVRYSYSYGPLQSGLKGSDLLRWQAVLLPLSAMGAGAARPLLAADGASKALVLGRSAQKSETPRTTGTYELPRFEQALRERNETPLLATEIIRSRLTVPQRLPYRTLLNEFEIRPDEWTRPDEDPLGCDFPLWKLNLKVTNPRLTQPRYQMDLRLEAADTDLEGPLVDGQPRPHIKASEERFVFLVVSENELLAEIAKEEEKLHADLELAFKEIGENEESKNRYCAEANLVQVTQDLSSEGVKPETLGAMSVRSEHVVQALDKGQISVREVATAYGRIDREMRTNQVDPDRIDKVQTKIVKPLGEADALFDTVRERVLDFRKTLDNNDLAFEQRVQAARAAGNAAKAEMKALVDHLLRILAAMEGLTDINKLVKIIAEIEKQEAEQSEKIKALKAELQRILLEGALGEDKPKDKK
jgi:hypothetical protein